MYRWIGTVLAVSCMAAIGHTGIANEDPHPAVAEQVAYIEEQDDYSSATATVEREPSALEIAAQSAVRMHNNADTPATDYASVDNLELIGTFKVTAYCGCPRCCSVWSSEHPSRVGTGYVQKTSSGTIPVARRTVAADWRVLPAGTDIVIGGHIYTVEDTGSAVKGKHIDIYMDNHAAAKEFGVQYLDVYREIVSD